MIHVQFHDYVGTGWNDVWWNWQGIIRFEDDSSYSYPLMIRKPGYYTFNLLSQKLYGFDSSQILDINKEVFCYEFAFNDKNPVYVIWSEGMQENIDLSNYINSSTSKNNSYCYRIR